VYAWEPPFRLLFVEALRDEAATPTCCKLSPSKEKIGLRVRAMVRVRVKVRVGVP